MRPRLPSPEWTFDLPLSRMPESAAPKLGKNSSVVTMEVEIPNNADGVLYALGGISGGLACFMKDGFLHYEFNLFAIQRTKIRSPVGVAPRQGDDRNRVGARGSDRRTDGRDDEGERNSGGPRYRARRDDAALHIERYVRRRNGSRLPVSLDYHEKAPFSFEGKIGRTHRGLPEGA
jgi:arylsulfatase